jgi:hypothetical protein
MPDTLGLMTDKKISIIIPVKPGGTIKALAQLSEIDYPAELFEILIAQGRRPSRQRNRAAAEAGGDILYFLDDDSMTSPQFLKRVVTYYEDSAVAAVGGPSLTPADDIPQQKAVGLAFASFFGGGGVRNRYRQIGTARATGDNELILCNLSFRKESYLAFGGLDERLYPNEENELMDRLKKEGFRLIHDPDLAVYRSQRPSFSAFLRQMFSYGRGRAEQTLITGEIQFINLIPSLFLLYLLILPVFISSVYVIPFLCYALAVCSCALLEALKAGRGSLLPRLLLIFPALHLAYGAGVLMGAISPRFKKTGPEMETVTITRVKEFGPALAKTE